MALALAVGCFGMFPSRLGMALGLSGFLVAFGMLALAMMFCRSPVTLGGIFVMLGGLCMRFLGHAILLWFATPIKPVRPAAVPLTRSMAAMP
jgi:hypothetical protein